MAAAQRNPGLGTATFTNITTPEQRNSGHLQYSLRIPVRTLKKIEFSKDNHQSLRFQIIKNDHNEIYLGFSKFYFDEPSDSWHPSKKNFYMKPEQWTEFQSHIQEINRFMASQATPHPLIRYVDRGGRLLLILSL